MRVKIGFMSAFALIAQGCNRESHVAAHCVDDRGIVVDESNCIDGGVVGDVVDAGVELIDGAVNQMVVPSEHVPTHIFVYRWWYGGYTPIGSPVVGGSYTMPVGMTSVPHAAAVPVGGVGEAPAVRGGFGTPGGVAGGE